VDTERSIPNVERLVDRVLSCGGDIGDAYEAGRAIHLAAPVGDWSGPPDATSGQVEVRHRPWAWLATVANAAEAGGHDMISGKIALFCFLWNRMLVPKDPRMGTALPEAPKPVEAGIYATGLRCLLRLPAGYRLGGDLRGEFLVRDARLRTAAGLILLYEAGVPVSPTAHRDAAELMQRG
jgi:hypothetical protein